MTMLRLGLVLFLILFPVAAVCPLPALRRQNRERRNAYIRSIPVIVLLAALALAALPAGTAELPYALGLGLRFETGSLHSLLAVLTAFLWVMATLPCRAYFAAASNRSRFYVFWLLTLGALEGVFLSADLFTLFVFFEVMSFTSYAWVAQNEDEGALRAGETYLAVAVFGGMMLLVGIMLLHYLLGTTVFARMPALIAALPAERKGLLWAAGLLCLTGFGAKAGMFPLHIWLPKAHPVAPAPASALLSGILTKSGVFGILVVSRFVFLTEARWNTVILGLGVVTMVLGAVLALFSIDLKRTLACSSMSQIGFILVGVAMQGYLGEENALAAWGTVLHMLNHSLIKLVLFIIAGVVYLGNHSLDLNVIRGWGRGRPLLRAFFFTGAASIAGVPGFSGYVSKTLLHESIVEYIHELEYLGAATGGFRAVEWLFLFSGGLTAAYMTRLFLAIFVENRAGVRRVRAREYVGPATLTPLWAGSVALVLLGLTPGLTMQPLAQWAAEFLQAGHGSETLHYFSWANLQGALISLAIGAAVYLLIVRRFLEVRDGEKTVYPNRWPERLDLESLVYRPAVRGAAFVGAMCARIAGEVGDLLVLTGEKLLFLKAPGVFVPRKNEDFGVYIRKPKRFLIGETFSFDLTLAGIGLIGILAYILM